MKLDMNLEKINYSAVWFERNEDAWMPRNKAIDEIESGRAKVVAPNKILLLHKLKPFRIRILERDNHICYFCGEYGNTLEHLLPVSKGGKNTEDNCVCACATCNQEKGNMTESEYWNHLTNVYLWKKKEKQLLKEIFS
jgi:CRISPR/Cas system Type II protein with McrA/HNH and RuvC-like nuclease domain